MLKTIILSILIILSAVNLVLLLQSWRKMKQNMDKTLETIKPYISLRLTVFAVNMTVICAILIGSALLQLLFHA